MPILQRFHEIVAEEKAGEPALKQYPKLENT